MITSDEFQEILNQVFQLSAQEPWYTRAQNYVVEINTTDKPQDGNSVTLATTTRGGHMPTRIIYYVRNISKPTVAELYRITKHEFAHLWGLGEDDAQAVEP